MCFFTTMADINGECVIFLKGFVKAVKLISMEVGKRLVDEYGISDYRAKEKT